jgi:hypothetical protein
MKCHYYLRRIVGRLLTIFARLDNAFANKNNLIRDRGKLKITNQKRICIYVTYGDQESEIHTLKSIEYLESHFFLVLHINNMEEKFNNPKNRVIYRENKGHDLAAIRDALSLLGNVPKELLILNSSFIYFPGGLEKVITSAREVNFDVIGLTESFQTRRHIQSFFFYSQTDKGVESLIQTYSKMRNWRTKRAAVNFGEIPILSELEKSGATVGTIAQYSQLKRIATEKNYLVDNKTTQFLKLGVSLNPSQHLWKVLWECGIPGVKRNLFLSNPAKLGNAPISYEQAYDLFKGN